MFQPAKDMCDILVVRGMADDAYADGPPPFENPFDGEDEKRRVYGAVLHAREPMTVSELANRADCSAESTRSLLSFYAELGIVNRHEGRPVRYERNDEYFEWRRVNTLVQEHTIDELESKVSELTDRVEEYRDQYDADSPTAVNVFEFDEAHVDDVYGELGNWATAIEDLRLHERARAKMATMSDSGLSVADRCEES